MRLNKNSLLYSFLRLLYIWVRFKRKSRNGVLIEIYSFIISYLKKFQVKNNMRPIYLNGEVSYITTTDNLKLSVNTDYNYPVGCGQLLEFYFDNDNSFEKTFIFPYLVENSVYLDVGANNGYYYALKVAKYRADINVVCFEPNLGLQKILLDNVKLNKLQNVSVSPFALGEQDCEMYLQASSGASGFLRQTCLRGCERVLVKALDGLYDATKRISYIKVDIEGLELSFLKGAKDTLIEHKPLILLEYDENLLIKNGNTTQKNLLDFMESIRYKVYLIKNSRDALCVHSQNLSILSDEIKVKLV